MGLDRRVPDLMDVGRWRRSSRCISSGCVEVQVLDDTVLVRNSTDTGGPVLRYTRDEWSAFVEGVRAGEFGLDGV